MILNLPSSLFQSCDLETKVSVLETTRSSLVSVGCRDIRADIKNHGLGQYGA